MIYLLNNFILFFTLTSYLFHNVLSISPCDSKQIPFESQSQDIFDSLEDSTVNSDNRPLLQEIVSTTVNLSLAINDLNIIDIKNLDVEMDLEITQKWYDHRLAPNYKTRNLAVLGEIWKPKITFVVGNKLCNSNTCSNEDYDQTQFWRGTSNGSVFYSERFLVKPKCTKDLTKYPFDSQTCLLKIGSYRFTAEEVKLEWIDKNPVEILRIGKELGEFHLKKLKTYNETDIRSAGNFSVLVLEIHVTRYSRREVIQTFIPSIIFVKIAYGVFWMKLSEIRTRIYTCQFSLAGMLFLFASSNNYNVSNITYLKALDVWFLISLVFVLFPLGESILVHYFNSDIDNKVEENFENAETEFEDGYETKFSKKNPTIWTEKILRLLHPMGLLSAAILFITVFNYN